MQPPAAWVTDSDLKMIRIDLSAEEMDRINKPDIGIVGDAATILTALANALLKHNAKRASRKDELDEARAKTMEMLASSRRIWRISTLSEMHYRKMTSSSTSSPGQLYQPPRYAGLQSAELYRFRLPRHARLGVRDRSRRQGRAS